MVDPFPDAIGVPYPRISTEVVIVTHDHFDHNAVDLISGEFDLLTGPLPAESHGISFSFYPCFHDNAEGVRAGPNQIVRWQLDGLTVIHLGDLGHLLDQDLTRLLHGPDLLFVPVGGCGSTLDATQAGKVVAQLEPRVVIPMHYQEDGVRMHLDPVDRFLVGRHWVQAPELLLERQSLPNRRTVTVLDRYVYVPEEVAG